MPYTDAKTLNIFLSYAHEDQPIADAIAGCLRAAFFDTFEITMMSEFPSGLNWRKQIDDAIESTDIMVAITTGRLKPGHSFTGYEIGSFSFSLRSNPTIKIAPDVLRRIIPFAVLDRTPSAMNEFEGIDISPESLHDVRFDAGDLTREIANLSKDGSDEATQKVFKFLTDIQDLISEALPTTRQRIAQNKARIVFLNDLSFQLCQALFSLISNREKSVVLPRSKLIIKTRPQSNPLDDFLIDASVETKGSCDESFGIQIEDQSYDWRSFLDKASGPDISYSWNKAFRAIIEKPKINDIVESNTIISYDRRLLFRLFVAQIKTFYSGAREFHIYVIPLLRPRDYGDFRTTILLKALQVGLGYRFMFLEESSEFSPNLFRATKISDLQAKVFKMQNSLNLLLQTANQAGLSDTEVVVSILGLEAVPELDTLYDTWDSQKAALFEVSRDILAAAATKELKEKFLQRLGSFCEHTKELNLRYTHCVMEQLKEKIV